MIEQRRLRFSNIMGLERDDLQLAGEVWLDDLYRAPWASPNAMKLGTLFVRYMSSVDATMLALDEVESQYELTRHEIGGALSLMRMFGAIESFRYERNELRASLNLSLLQRLKTLEAKQRFCDLLQHSRTGKSPWQAQAGKWAPRPVLEPAAPRPVLARIADGTAGH